MVDAARIVALHDAANAQGHDASQAGPVEETAFDSLVVAQHRANFELWHREDAARDPMAADAEIVQAKRDIDRLNQTRNDLVERMDAALLAGVTQDESAPLHSETPGMMVDRLSILSLKMFHTKEEARRVGATAEHWERNRARLAVLEQQRKDLSECLDALWREMGAGLRRFKVYRQMKMYNDPELNPVLYRRGRRSGA